MFKKEIRLTKIVEITHNHHKVLINGETAGWIIRDKQGGDNWVIRDPALTLTHEEDRSPIYTWEEAIDAIDLLPLPAVLNEQADNLQPQTKPKRDPDDWRPGDKVPGNPEFTVVEVEYKVWVEIERIAKIASDGTEDELYDHVSDVSSIGSFSTLEEAWRARDNTYILGMNSSPTE